MLDSFPILNGTFKPAPDITQWKLKLLNTVEPLTVTKPDICPQTTVETKNPAHSFHISLHWICSASKSAAVLLSNLSFAKWSRCVFQRWLTHINTHNLCVHSQTGGLKQMPPPESAQRGWSSQSCCHFPPRLRSNRTSRYTFAKGTTTALHSDNMLLLRELRLLSHHISFRGAGRSVLRRWRDKTSCHSHVSSILSWFTLHDGLEWSNGPFILLLWC